MTDLMPEAAVDVDEVVDGSVVASSAGLDAVNTLDGDEQHATARPGRPSG